MHYLRGVRLTLWACQPRLSASINSPRGLHGLPPKQEYEEQAKYPPLPKLTDKNKIEEAKLVDKFDQLKTVEEKLYYLNMPKYYGWYSAVIKDQMIPYGCLDFAQYSTWTRTVPGLPALYQSPELDSLATELAAKVAPEVEKLMLKDLDQWQGMHQVPNDKIFPNEKHATVSSPVVDQKARTHHLVRSLNRIFQVMLEPEAPHLRDAQVCLWH